MSYFEAHLTVEQADQADMFMPTFMDFAIRSKEIGWKASRFDHDDVDGAVGKWFLSFRADYRSDIINETKGMIHSLECSGLTVLRWKIEQTVADSKLGHSIEELT